MKWEYVVERLHTRLGEGLAMAETELLLKKLGDEGWEAVTAWHQGGPGENRTYMVFKRPLPN
jgi:hypothetical protein